jgi:hypothetical protein
MKKDSREEIYRYFRDNAAIVAINIPTLSTLLAILSGLQGKPYLISLLGYILGFYAVFFNSVYIAFSRQKEIISSTPGQPPEIKYSSKYPSLRKFGFAGMALSVLFIPSIFVFPALHKPVDIFFNGTPTLTPTQTLTITPSATFTLSPTPRSEADYSYYMVVLDATINMKNSFHGYSMWDAAIKTTNEVLRVLPQKSHYGLVVIGGTDAPGKSSPCEEPSTVTMPFSPQNQVWENITRLTPTGGGSFLSAFLTARDQLLELEPTMSKAMVFITGANDTCEGEDEWEGLKKALEVTDNVKIYSQIVILDENGAKSQVIADRINSVSENVNAQAPQTVADIQAGGTTVVSVVNNVKYYVNTYYNTVINQIPTSIPLSPTNTATLKPGETPLPTLTFTNIPTLVPTFTRTFTPVPPSPTVLVCPSVSHPVLVGQGLGGSADIYSPAPCTINLAPETAIVGSGVYSNIPDGTYVWELVYASDHLFYPQSPNACGGGAPPNQDGTNWSVNTYLGKKEDTEQKWYDIVVVVADQAASDQLSSWLVNNCPVFPGISYETLSQWNITEKVSITVRIN